MESYEPTKVFLWHHRNLNRLLYQHIVPILFLFMDFQFIFIYPIYLFTFLPLILLHVFSLYLSETVYIRPAPMVLQITGPPNMDDGAQFISAGSGEPQYPQFHCWVFPTCCYQHARRRDPKGRVLDRDRLSQPHQPPRHHQTELEGSHAEVCGKHATPIQNPDRPRAKVPTLDHGKSARAPHRRWGTICCNEWARTRGQETSSHPESWALSESDQGSEPVHLLDPCEEESIPTEAHPAQ